ncbi:MAG TPA: NnrU family protein [Rhizomicrobium sp.]|nr:NnrU family protein [Rhizomicrobium sp.]
MSTLIAAAAAFLAIHFLVSGTPLRDRITAATGEGPYLGLFSLASLALIVWLVIAYNRAQAGDDPQLYDLGEGVRHLGIPIVAIAFFVGVQGLFLRNPTRVQMAGTAQDEGVVTGVLRITRHPFLWGVALWSGFHLAANGDEASVIFFGTFFVLALVGTVLIDAKRRRKLGAAWNAFSAKTSNVPFGAAIAGCNRIRFGEIFGWRFWVATVLFLVILFCHPRLFGVSPFPGGWVPF